MNRQKFFFHQNYPEPCISPPLVPCFAAVAWRERDREGEGEGEGDIERDSGILFGLSGSRFQPHTHDVRILTLSCGKLALSPFRSHSSIDVAGCFSLSHSLGRMGSLRSLYLRSKDGPVSLRSMIDRWAKGRKMGKIIREREGGFTALHCLPAPSIAMRPVSLYCFFF